MSGMVLSQTAAASEKLKSGPGAGWDPSTDAWYTAASSGGGYPATEKLLDLCTGYAGTPTEFHGTTGRTWYYGGFPFTWYNHAAGPDPGFPDCSVHPERGLHPRDRRRLLRRQRPLGAGSTCC